MEREMKRQQALLDKLMDPNLTDEERKALMAGEKDRRVKSKRKSGGGPLIEPEPLLMPFWRGAWHGVPFDERLKMSDFEFYLDMLAAVAKTVRDEHTLQLKSVGALDCHGLPWIALD
jgi:hypothetical protein